MPVCCAAAFLTVVMCKTVRAFSFLQKPACGLAGPVLPKSRPVSLTPTDPKLRGIYAPIEHAFELSHHGAGEVPMSTRISIRGSLGHARCTANGSSAGAFILIAIRTLRIA
jgi:hypothetical protein